MLSPRWRKLLADVNATQGRTLMMVFAIALGVFGVGLILSAFTILTREMTRNYTSTNPASILLELDKVDNNLLQAVRKRPGIAQAEASQMVVGRLELQKDQWMPILLFVIPDFNAIKINSFTFELGAKSPPAGSILFEREALRLTQQKIGNNVWIQTPNGTKRKILISGVVHDPGLAPAGQEQTAYGYVSPDTIAWLGESKTFNILKIVVKTQPLELESIEQTTKALAVWLTTNGRSIEEIRIPPPGKHPHQSQMTAILTMFLIFSGLTLVLSSILSATMIAGMLAQQVRQIGVMKAIGARSLQIAGLYLALIFMIGCLALILGLPLGIMAGQGFASIIAELLNFTIYDNSVPLWVYALLVAIGILIPLLVALLPILKATNVSVLEAINDYGSSRTVTWRFFDPLLEKLRDRSLILAIRNTFRRKGRLFLTLGLLAAAGAMFMTALNVKASWESALAQAADDRRYDLELRFQNAPEQSVLKMVAKIPGVQNVETWNRSPAGVARDDGLNIVRTYPDGGHASFALRSVPENTKMVHLTMFAGHWLLATDSNAVVLNHTAKAAFYPGAKIGEIIKINVQGRVAAFKLVGVAREIVTPAAAYVPPKTYARTTGLFAQTNAIRVVLSDHSARNIDRQVAIIEAALERQGIHIEVSISETRLSGALDGHVYILIASLIAMSILMAFVGVLGLMSAMSTSVIERTREFGIMRTLGARALTVLRNVVSEGVFIGFLSWFVAIGLSLPLSAGIGNLVGMLSFRLPLPLLLSPSALFLWLGLIVLGSMAASLYPAWKASQLTIRQAIAFV
jgi:putative ABC transport system permease protein